MEAVLKDAQGKAFAIHPLLEWELIHSCGEASDAFSLRVLWNEALNTILEKAVYFEAAHEGERVFSGVVDEFEITASEKGKTALICGRGMGARLLDNPAFPGRISAATPEYILQSQVRPFGITAAEAPESGTPAAITVYSGESRWSVVRRFSEAYYGARPRFDVHGRLLLDGGSGRFRAFTAKIPLTELRYTHRRYGVISEAMVRANTVGRQVTVENAEFKASGGCASRVLSVPNRTDRTTMRELGEHMIAESERGAKCLTLRTPILFAALAGDRVHLGWTGIGVDGTFTVEESRCHCSGDRAETVLTLYRKED